MRIKTAVMDYEEVLALPPAVHIRPVKQNLFIRFLLKALSSGELKAVHFQCNKIGMEKLKPGQPCLFLMNHSSFIDLKIVSTLLYPHPFNIVCTSDGFVGKSRLMRLIGCIPTKKFITDITLVRDMIYTVKELKSSIVMYPEASYSFDGTATPLPDSIGKCLKLLKVPVVMIRTYGAFLRDPLYNGLQLRKVMCQRIWNICCRRKRSHRKRRSSSTKFLRRNSILTTSAGSRKTGSGLRSRLGRTV